MRTHTRTHTHTHTGIDMGKVVLLNLIYDLTAPGFHHASNDGGVLACTSIVAEVWL